ncbi:ExeA family protein [Ideonella paludis]|uniref:AAA family ATPase n=1 Tax=Ideonella paludis TaxID=1233411 RepID=A0ABS5DVL4_9BURK|nr:ExeA family protein [Ideonella paludis]MBQ0935184.1 AAA family ATPase [Ideonella paludis]
MYAKFFGLSQTPFSIAPDPRYLYMSERHRDALAHLLWGVGAGGGFVLLSGDIGAGKTTVCRCFLEQLPPQCTVAYIFNPSLTVDELLQTVCQEFGVALPEAPQTPGSTKGMVDALNTFLLQEHAAGRSCVLIIDEAQSLSAPVLEQLRLLTNLETAERKLLQIILIGQPELRDILARPELEQLSQRVVAQFHLEALSPAETHQYVQHRLSVAGWQGPSPFEPRALARIQQLTKGVPRRINLLCDRALLGAYALGLKTIDRHMVDKAALEVFARPRAASASQTSWLGRFGVFGGLGAGLLSLGLAAVWWWPNHGPSRTVETLTLPQGKPKLPPEGSASSPTTASGPLKPAVAAELTVASADDLQTKQPAVAASAALGAMPERGQWWKQEATPLGLLVERWGGQVSKGDVCEQAVAQSLRCFRAYGSTQLIRLLDRPVMLLLQDESGAKGQVLLWGMRPDQALVQHKDGQLWVRWIDLAPHWRGEFVTLWRTSEAWAQRDDAAALKGIQAALRQLGVAPKAASGAGGEVSAAIYAFQAAQGLRPDGKGNVQTLMLLNRAMAVKEPRLGEER